MWNYFLFKASVGVRKKLISWPKILPEFHIHMPELFDFEFGSSWTYVLIALLTFSTRSKRRLFTVQLLSNYVVPYSCRSGLHLQFKSESVPHFRDACNTITDLLTSIWLLCSLFAVKLPIKKHFLCLLTMDPFMTRVDIFACLMAFPDFYFSCVPFVVITSLLWYPVQCPGFSQLLRDVASMLPFTSKWLNVLHQYLTWRLTLLLHF